MKKFAVLTLLLFLCALPVYPDSKNVSLATFNWEPFVGENLKDNGVVSKIVEEAFKRKGYDVTLKFIPWSIAVTHLKSRQYDAGYPALRDEETAKKFIFSNVIMEKKIGFYKKKNREISYTELKDLEPYKIGVVQSYVYSPEFENATYLNKKDAQNDRQNLQKLLKNQIDLALIDKTVAQNILNKDLSDGERESIEFMPHPLEVKTLHLIVSPALQNGRELIKNFNTGLDALKRDGTYKQILFEYGFNQ